MRKFRPILYVAFLALCLCASVVNLSCSSKPTDIRTLVPADTFVYLETNDMAAALQPIVDNKAFEAAARSKPDLSALKGVQFAVAVTGIEMTEEKITEEQSNARIQPRFVAIADTHAFNYQAVRFAEEKLGSFVATMYDDETTVERSDKHGGKYFTWTVGGKKAYPLVIDSMIWFGNDESAIDKCLAVRRGEADSIAKTGKVSPTGTATLASGYISTEGVAQIAAAIGIKFANEASDKPEVQSAIAGILPPLIRNSILEITWTSNSSDQSVTDVYQISMAPNIPTEASATLAELGNAITDSIFSPTAADLAEVLSERRPEAEVNDQSFRGQNRLTKNGIERRIVSDFGLIGSIIAQLGGN